MREWVGSIGWAGEDGWYIGLDVWVSEVEVVRSVLERDGEGGTCHRPTSLVKRKENGGISGQLSSRGKRRGKDESSPSGGWVSG